MEKEIKIKLSKEAQGYLAVVVLLVVVLSYGGYEYYLLSEEKELLLQEVAGLNQTLETTQNLLSESENESAFLADALDSEQQKVQSIESAVDEVTDIVSDLQKLEAIDVELLQKYSKVYFLNEHYVPDGLVEIPKEFLYYEDDPEQIESRTWPFLKNMLDAAEADGIDLYVASGYRSFDQQSVLKAGYTVIYGSGANTFSADQGYSEHQLGTAVDFLTTGIGGTLPGFGDTQAYEWLLDNAHDYGFVLSYPEGNAYYVFEPWHWRFVGEDLADDLRDEALYFYDLPQSVIDTYRLEFFD